jgi:hypothetical protein
MVCQSLNLSAILKDLLQLLPPRDPEKNRRRAVSSSEIEELIETVLGLPSAELPRRLGRSLCFASWGKLARKAGLIHDNQICRRIDSRFLLPSRGRLPQINCYPAAELRGGGGDGEATEHGNTARAEGCN